MGAWAYAKAGHDDAQLFSTLVVAAQRRVTEFNTQELDTIAWVFEKMGQPPAPLFAAWATEADRRMGESDQISTEWARISRELSSAKFQNQTAVSTFLAASSAEVTNPSITPASVLLGFVVGSAIAFV